MMPATLATPGFLKIEIFQNKGYDVNNKILSGNSNYIVDVIMCSSISIREVTSIL